MRAAMKIIIALVLSLASYAQAETVTVVESKTVSETTPAPDCGRLVGFQAGMCEAQRERAQTPTAHMYYMLESEHTAYVLTCVPGGYLSRGRCPVLVPGQEYTLSVKGDHVLLKTPRTKVMKFGLVEATSWKP